MLGKIRLKMLILHAYRQEESERAVSQFIKACLFQTTALFGAMIAIVAIGEVGAGMAILFVFMPAIWPYILIRRLDNRIANMRLMILMELPVFVSKLLLLLQAGLTLNNAWLRSAESYSSKDHHPFAKQMIVVRNQLRHSAPFAQAIEGLARRCASQEVTFFTSAILMNYKRGGDDLIHSLRVLSRDLWEKRKAAVKKLGEEASAKMIFPLMVVFIAVMIAVGAPALLQIR